MFRKAILEDLQDISDIYDAIHTKEEAGNTSIGWVRKIYPTKETARASIEQKDMFVEEVDGKIVAVAKINQEQVPEYADAAWEFEVPEEQVMVLHTLVVDPRIKSHGYGRTFVSFYEKYALENGCHYLRMDTNDRNRSARKLYRELGYNEVSIVACEFNGIKGVRLVCLEKMI
ncbi:MAG: GNAT family N-acetyltransferase [Lachnospiraceae bacterium]|nr:GNAT family N-acetyltransferase [Lachnospiraceae bacterium]